MSAFVCSNEHIKALALFAAARSHGSTNVDPRYVKGMDGGLHAESQVKLASVYADMLFNENVRSVQYRYPADKRSDYELHLFVTGRDATGRLAHVPAISILKMCDCLEYQSCETDDYEQTTAYRLLDAIRRHAIRSLPGYEDAPWDYHIPETKAA